MFRGWLQIDGAEVANSSRVITHMTADDEMSCQCDITIPYDDSWTGLEAELNNGPYTITTAPWYDPARPESAEFAGVWVMQVDGMDAVTMSRNVAEAICAGGSAGVARDTSQVFQFSALVIACTNAGARYGLDWLACRLRAANARGGVLMDYYKAHPQDTAASAVSLRRARHGVVLTSAPTVVEFAGKGGSNRHRQASVFRVEWEMTALNPYAYGTKVVLPVVWDVVSEESIEWAHAPDCDDTGACDLPTIYNADCVPPNIEIAPSVIPSCGGCLPLCSIERRVVAITDLPGTCDVTVVSVRVINESETDNLTVIMYWQPCGSTESCDRVYPLQVSGLPPGVIAVADSVTGRPYADVGGTPHRQVGIVGTPSGAPWRRTLLNSSECWELVAESAPGAEYSVTVELQERDS